MTTEEAPVGSVEAEGRPDCWERFDAYRKEVYAQPDGGQGLVKLYDNFSENYNKAGVHNEGT